MKNYKKRLLRRPFGAPRNDNIKTIFISCLLIITPMSVCLAQETKTESTEAPGLPAFEQLPMLQQEENRFLLKGTIVIQFEPGKVVEKEGVLETEDLDLKGGFEKEGVTRLQVTPYEIKAGNKIVLIPNVYRLTIPTRLDPLELCKTLLQTPGIRTVKPIYVNFKPKRPDVLPDGLPPPTMVSTYPDFELWDFNLAPGKSFPADFISISKMPADPGMWLVKDGVLSQKNPTGDTDQLHLALLTEYEDHDVKLKMRIKCSADGLYKAGGVINRFTNFQSYYSISFDFVNKKIGFYRMVKGVQEPLMVVDAPLETEKWYSIEMVTNGPRCLVFLNGTPFINQSDDKIWHGKVGFWTQADNSFQFDDFSVEKIKS